MRYLLASASVRSGELSVRSFVSSLLLLVLSLGAAACAVVDDATEGLGDLVGAGHEVPHLEAGRTFSDDFDPPDDVWFLGEDGPFRFQAADGAYVVEGRPEDATFLIPRTYPGDADVTVSTTFRVVEQPDERGGIVGLGCHLAPDTVDDHGFGAVVQAWEGDLYYGLLEWVDGGIEAVVSLDEPAPDFDPEGETPLALTCRPSSGSMHLELSIDGEVLATADVDLAEGLPNVVAAGLYVDTSPLVDDECLEVRFERFGVDLAGS